MPSSKNLYYERIKSLLILITFVALFSCLLGKALTPVTFSDYFNHDISLIDEKNEDIELVIFGDSKVYSSMDTRVIEKRLGYKNVLLASTSSQSIVDTYYQLKDLTERFDLKEVIINIDFETMQEETKLMAMLLTTDRLSFSNKLLMFKNCFRGIDRLNILKVYRYRENIDDIKKLMTDKYNLIKNNYTDNPDNDEFYCYKGFVCRRNAVKTGNMPMYSHNKFDENDILEENIYYFDKCIELCKTKGIDVKLIECPTTMMRLYYVDNFGEAVKYYEKLALNYGLKFYNLDYLKGRESFLPDEMMYDYLHTNVEGAKIVSNIFCDILLKEKESEDISDYFYKDFEELSADVDRIVSVDAEIEKQDDYFCFNLRSLHPNHLTSIYKIEYLDINNKYKTLIDWTELRDLKARIPEDYNGELKVIAAKNQNDYKYAYQTYHLVIDN